LTPELALRLDRDAVEPLGSQLRESLREALRSGRLSPGERLPSSRTLAADLGISRGLVQTVYEQLSAEGYLVTRAGAPTRAAPAFPQSSVEARPAVGVRSPAIDFAPGLPDLRSFPMRDWVWACREVARTASARDIDYGPAAGSLRLREIAASYLRRVRGVVADSGGMVVTTGFTQGAALTLAVLKARGARAVAVEDPGHPAMPSMIRRAGLRPIPVRVDEEGLAVDDLRSTGATAAILTPAHQTPTGVVLSPTRRLALIDWARQVDGLVIEDDYDSEFRYDKSPVGSLQGLAPDRVVYLGSVSKALGPAVRLGWAVPPAYLLRELAAEKRLADHGSSGLDQLALAWLMESGRYDRHLRRMRKTYAARRRTLIDSLAVHAPHLPLTGLDAGFHALATLATDEARTIARAAERSVGLHGLTPYRSPTSTSAAGIVFGFGNLNESSIAQGIEQIADLLRN
jgi:GntR family transcriptional regulator / MocR family aminotransferase